MQSENILELHTWIHKLVAAPWCLQECHTNTISLLFTLYKTQLLCSSKALPDYFAWVNVFCYYNIDRFFSNFHFWLFLKCCCSQSFTTFRLQHSSSLVVWNVAARWFCSLFSLFCFSCGCESAWFGVSHCTHLTQLKKERAKISFTELKKDFVKFQIFNIQFLETVSLTTEDGERRPCISGKAPPMHENHFWDVCEIMRKHLH